MKTINLSVRVIFEERENSIENPVSSSDLRRDDVDCIENKLPNQHINE